MPCQVQGFLSKLGTTLLRLILQQYLKVKKYFRFKTQQKPFLIDKYKAARLK